MCYLFSQLNISLTSFVFTISTLLLESSQAAATRLPSSISCGAKYIFNTTVNQDIKCSRGPTDCWNDQANSVGMLAVTHSTETVFETSRHKSNNDVVYFVFPGTSTWKAPGVESNMTTGQASPTNKRLSIVRLGGERWCAFTRPGRNITCRPSMTSFVSRACRSHYHNKFLSSQSVSALFRSSFILSRSAAGILPVGLQEQLHVQQNSDATRRILAAQPHWPGCTHVAPPQVHSSFSTATKRSFCQQFLLNNVKNVRND